MNTKTTTTLDLQVGTARLPATLALPEDASGVVVFAHGSGSSRFSPRNQFVAQQLQHAGFATMLFDLLNADEADDRYNVFDIDLITTRLTEAADLVSALDQTRALPLGLFGASTGSAAALMTAARRRDCVAAVVSRGGRPDLARELADVAAPTLLIVGGEDRTVIELNQQALERLPCKAELAIVPGATHLFSEPGALEQVTRLARDWYKKHLQPK